jgi:4-hydroxybenzoyl-CoA reductase subunit beta
MSSMPNFVLLRPETAADAVRLRAAHPDSRFVAGGTDLLPNMRRGLVRTPAVIELAAVRELDFIRRSGDELHIGAACTLAALAADPQVAAALPALSEAARAVAGPTHRASATLGGNLCLDTRCRYYNQSAFWREANQFCMKLDGDGCRVAPRSTRCHAAFSGDVAPALIALDARVDILGTGGVRTLPLAELYRDDGMAWLALGSEELLTAVRVPLTAGWQSAYAKARVRGAIDFPLSGVAVALRRDGERLAILRIACTGVASRPCAIGGLDVLAGRPLDAAAHDIIALAIKRDILAMDTTVAGMAYRRRATAVLAKRLVDRLWQEAA